MKIIIKKSGIKFNPENKFEKAYMRTVLHRMMFVYPDSEIVTFANDVHITEETSDYNKTFTKERMDCEKLSGNRKENS